MGEGQPERLIELIDDRRRVNEKALTDHERKKEGDRQKQTETVSQLVKQTRHK